MLGQLTLQSVLPVVTAPLVEVHSLRGRGVPMYASAPVAGWACILVIIALEVAGFIIIRKIIKIDV